MMGGATSMATGCLEHEHGGTRKCAVLGGGLGALPLIPSPHRHRTWEGARRREELHGVRMACCGATGCWRMKDETVARLERAFPSTRELTGARNSLIDAGPAPRALPSSV